MKQGQTLNVVGKTTPRLDGKEKVTGKAVYTVDIELPGMAHAKILRSPYAHARLAPVDGRRAEALPGVYAVITGDDQRRLGMFGAAYKDQTIVAVDKGRYVGDAVAAVAAVDEATAEQALNLLEVEYEELPSVTSIDEALAPGAPLVHDAASSGGEMMGQRYEIPPEFAGTNLCYRFSYAKGDVEQGFKSADDIFEDTFSFPRVQHFSMEHHATVAHVEQDRMTLWAATQEPFTLRDHLADIFRLPLNKIRIIAPYLGGAYGGKLAIKTEPLTAALSWKAKRPVRLAHSIEESFKTITRHPARVLIKTGVTKDGKILARQCLIHMETGAYADAGPRVTQNADGSIILLTGTVEIGQGALTALSQIVAEELAIPLERVTVAQLDTDVTPYDVNTNASSSTVVMGLSVQRAAQDLKRQLLRHAGKLLKTNSDRLSLKNGHIQGGKGSAISFEELMHRVFLSSAGEIVGRGAYQDIKSKKAALGSPTTFWEISWGGAEVEIDRDTGEIKLLKYVSLADVGQAIHPVLCEGQDEGGVMNSIGHSLLEEMIYKDGQLLNPNLIDYRVPSFDDLPRDFETILV